MSEFLKIIKKVKKLCFEVNSFWIAKIVTVDIKSNALSKTSQTRIKSKNRSSQLFISRLFLSLSKSVIFTFIAFKFSKDSKTNSCLQTFRTMRRFTFIVEISDFFLMIWKSFENLVVDSYFIVLKKMFRLINYRFRQNNWSLKVLSKIKWKRI